MTNHAAIKAFKKVKKLITEVHVMHLPNFSKVFEVTCDISGLEICGMLSQKNHPIAYFSDKLNDARQRCSTYDNKFYVVEQTLRYWRHYLLPRDICLSIQPNQTGPQC